MTRNLMLLSILLCVLTLTGCSESYENEVRDRANVECAERVTQMRADLNAHMQRALLLAAGDERLLRSVQFSSRSTPFRNPNPCFGHVSLAHGVPEGFRLSLDATLSGLRGDFDLAGRVREYDALEEGRVRAKIQEQLDAIRVLAGEVARSE